jgi:hypothetical protein
VVVRDGELKTVKVEEIRRKANQSAKKLRLILSDSAP